jgi:hypothetical protein
MTMHSPRRAAPLALSLACAVAFACGGGSDGDDDAAAGHTSTGGTTGSGGASASGRAGTGTNAGNGGSVTTGGTGGAPTTGGTPGVSGAGGAGAAGQGTGGALATGGTPGGSGTGGASGGGAGVGGSAGNGATSGGAGMSAGSGGSAGGGVCAADACPFDNGVGYDCKLRFMYGVNYAWQNFAADFGGGSRGVAATKSTVGSQLQNMAQNGTNVVRWWVWPNFTGGGVTFDANGTPTGLASTTLADLEAALELAETNDLYLMLTLFSFDNFKTAISPANQNMATLGTDATNRAALVNNVVKPFARAAKASTHGERVIAWDVINEPEWAVTGPSQYGGDEAFEADSTCTPVTHAQMETLLKDVIAGLRQESDARITVGAAAMKWRHAWSMLDQDFYQFHIYDWVNMYWPYSKSPTEYGMADKPMVMGEFPPEGLSGGIGYRTLLDSWYANGYAGALTWQDATFKINWSDVKSFADAHACETRY